MRYQVVAYLGNYLEIRIDPHDGYLKKECFEEAFHVLNIFLATHGVTNVEIFLSEEVPKQHPKSGKFNHIIHAGFRKTND